MTSQWVEGTYVKVEYTDWEYKVYYRPGKLRQIEVVRDSASDVGFAAILVYSDPSGRIFCVPSTRCKIITWSEYLQLEKEYLE